MDDAARALLHLNERDEARAERDRLAAALADRDAQVTRARALANKWVDSDNVSVAATARALRRALDGAGDEPRPFSPEAVAERLAANQDPHRQGLIPAEPTGDEPPTEPHVCERCGGPHRHRFDVCDACADALGWERSL